MPTLSLVHMRELYESDSVTYCFYKVAEVLRRVESRFQVQKFWQGSRRVRGLCEHRFEESGLFSLLARFFQWYTVLFASACSDSLRALTG